MPKGEKALVRLNKLPESTKLSPKIFSPVKDAAIASSGVRQVAIATPTAISDFFITDLTVLYTALHKNI